jgi:endonuclease YncB( thermonuclease family)
MKQAPILLALLLICTPALAQTYTVERVIDGDTLKLSNGERVQLIGLQAPEDENMGQEATE